MIYDEEDNKGLGADYDFDDGKFHERYDVDSNTNCSEAFFR